jgi:hypothetical protein
MFFAKSTGCVVKKKSGILLSITKKIREYPAGAKSAKNFLFTSVSVKINYIFGYIGFQNLNKTRSKMNIGGSLHCTAAVVPIIGHPLSLFATFRPLTAAGFES